MSEKKADKKPQSLVNQLAALIYFEGLKPDKRKDAMAFEKLTEAEQGPYILQVAKVFTALDKLNLAPGARPDQKKTEEDRNLKVDLLTEKIQAFVKTLTTTKPALFPCKELALRILAPEA